MEIDETVSGGGEMLAVSAQVINFVPLGCDNYINWVPAPAVLYKSMGLEVTTGTLAQLRGISNEIRVSLLGLVVVTGFAP